MSTLHCGDPKSICKRPVLKPSRLERTCEWKALDVPSPACCFEPVHRGAWGIEVRWIWEPVLPFRVYLGTDSVRLSQVGFAGFSLVCLGGTAINKYPGRLQLDLRQEYEGLGMQTRQ